MKPHLRNLLRFYGSINNNELINTQKLTSGDNLCCFNLRLISYFLVLQAVGIPTLIFLGVRSEELVDIWQAMLLGMEILIDHLFFKSLVCCNSRRTNSGIFELIRLNYLRIMEFCLFLPNKISQTRFRLWTLDMGNHRMA